MKVIIKTTKVYEKDVSRLLSLTEREKMENEIALDPLAWPLIRGTGGVRKARFSRGNRGKSGGGRVCSLYVQVMETIYMLKAYGKNEQENLSDTEKKLIKKLVEKILDIEGY